MSNQELEEIIQKLESLNKEEDAFFGVYQYGGAPDESYIKGNKEGLIRFAKELLKSSAKKVDLENKTYYTLEDNDWIDGMSDVYIDYIEVVDSTTYFKSIENNNQSHSGIAFGCLFFAVVILTVFVIGIITIIKWI